MGNNPLRILPILIMALSLHTTNGVSISTRSNENLHPVVIIPGSGGNQLEARLTDKYKPSSLFCRIAGRRRKKGDGWFRLWLEASTLLLPSLTRCFAERMTLYYNKEIDDYHNAPGVETRVPYFGSMEGLLHLDPRLKYISEYMAKLAGSLEEIGYKDGHNLFGAPYDFRYGLAAPGHPTRVGSEYLELLQQLIEHASRSNGGKPVILLTHSLGGLFALQLLKLVDRSWRVKYIKHLITLSAPWGGAVQEMLTYGSGYTLGIPLVDPLLVREEQRSSESNMWLLPSPALFGSKLLVLATSDNKSYSARDVPEFLKDIGFEDGVYPYRTRVLPLVSGLSDPGVNVTCFIGSGVDTPETLVYGGGGFDVQPDVIYGDGDGTVNMLSLLWLSSEFPSRVKVVKLPGVSHTSILKEEVALKKIIQELSIDNYIGLSFAA